MNKTKSYTSNILGDILNQTSKKDADRIKYRMLLAAKIDNALKAKGMKKKDLADITGKSQSTITQWLSGTHNFTSDTLFEIGEILNISLLNFNDIKQKEQVTVIQINISSETSAFMQNPWSNLYHSGMHTIGSQSNYKN